MSAASIPLVRPIRDSVSPEEWHARVDLAAAYRLCEHFGMTELISNHISLRVPGEDGHFLINPYGMLYDEITASSLIKIDLDGNVVLSTGDWGVNRAGFVIHSAIHAARPDAHCVAHTHTPAGMAVSAMACGILPLAQTMMRFLHVATHEFEGIADNEDERQRLVADLGPHNAMILRNHGLLVCGSSVGDAFNVLWRMERSCQTQVMALSCNTDLVFPRPDLAERTYEKLTSPRPRRPDALQPVSAWPALLRRLDRLDPSYRD